MEDRAITKLRQHRLDAGYSLRDVATITGTTHAAVYWWERGRVQPRPAARAKLEALFQRPAEQLLATEDD